MITYRVEIDDFNGVTRWYKWGTDDLHRENGPAVEYVDGRREWWVNGRYKDGLAIEYPDGYKCWYLNNERILDAK